VMDALPLVRKVPKKKPGCLCRASLYHFPRRQLLLIRELGERGRTGATRRHSAINRERCGKATSGR
jgi:hypothetical protein